MKRSRSVGVYRNDPGTAVLQRQNGHRTDIGQTLAAFVFVTRTLKVLFVVARREYLIPSSAGKYGVMDMSGQNIRQLLPGSRLPASDARRKLGLKKTSKCENEPSVRELHTVGWVVWHEEKGFRLLPASVGCLRKPAICD